MRFLFRSSKSAFSTTTPRVADDSVPHILVRLGKLSPFVLGAVLSSYSSTPDDEIVLRRLLEDKVVQPADVMTARMVQEKLRAGQPIYEEWAKLEAAMAESRRCALELSSVVSKGKRRRQERGEDTSTFLSAKRLRSAT